MFNKFKTIALTALAASALSMSVAQAAPANALSSGLMALGGNPAFQKVHSYHGNGHAKLHKVLKAHYYRIHITRAMRAAAGNPDMVVYDRRGGSPPYRCSFTNTSGNKAMICD